MAEEQIGRNKHGTTSSVGNPLCDETGRAAKSLRTKVRAGCIMMARRAELPARAARQKAANESENRERGGGGRDIP